MDEATSHLDTESERFVQKSHDAFNRSTVQQSLLRIGFQRFCMPIKFWFLTEAKL